MLSKYFGKRTETCEFQNRLKSIIENLNNKKTLIYGAGQGFIELNKQYNFVNKLNIIAIADKKFETQNETDVLKLKTIKPIDICQEDFDVVLVTNEYYAPIYNFLNNDLKIDSNKIKLIFEDEIKDEKINVDYLYRNKFDKTYKKLISKLKNKKIVLYGAGVYLEVINKYFDLSKLNIIAVSDKRYELLKDENEFLGYKICAPDEIINLKPDYVILSTKYYVKTFEYLKENVLKDKNLKIKPLVEKSFWTLAKETWKF